MRNEFDYHGQLTGGEIFPCLIRNLSQVSWIRKRDLHILTSMSVTYTSDARFKIVGNPEHDDWNLRIDYVQPRDSGIYECQVNAEPKIYRAITLKVLGEFLSLSTSHLSSSPSPPSPPPPLPLLQKRTLLFSAENLLFEMAARPFVRKT